MKTNEHFLKKTVQTLDSVNESLSYTAEEPEKMPDIPKETKKKFLELVGNYNKLGDTLQGETDLNELGKTFTEMATIAQNYVQSKTDGGFDEITVKRNMKDLGKLSTDFAKVASEANILQQRMLSLYDEMGHILNKYFKIKSKEN